MLSMLLVRDWMGMGDNSFEIQGIDPRACLL